jgi:hypothetical protein
MGENQTLEVPMLKSTNIKGSGKYTKKMGNNCYKNCVSIINTFIHYAVELLREHALVYLDTYTSKATAFNNMDPPTLRVRACGMETSFSTKETSKRA